MICLLKKGIALSLQLTYGLKRKIIFSLIFIIYINCPCLFGWIFLNAYMLYVFCTKWWYFFYFTAQTCRSKCNVYIDNLDDENKYMFRLRRVCVTIGTEHEFTKSSCQSSHKKPVSMHIECSSWNQSNIHGIFIQWFVTVWTSILNFERIGV